jgi:hypothetical protein
MNINYTHFSLLLINMLLIQHLVLGNNFENSLKDKNKDVDGISQAGDYCPGVFSFAGSEKTDPDCNTVPNGSITVKVSGGTPPYTFKWKYTGDTTQNRTDLYMGDYTVTVTDVTGCKADTFFHLNRPYNIYFDNTQNVCPGDLNGVINIYYATSCMCSYSHCTTEFTKDGQAVGTILNTTQGNAPGSALSNLASGVYHYKFTSTYGCVIYDSVTISPEPFSLTVQQTGESTAGAHDGTATATISGGTGPYTFQWNDPANQTTETATGLTGNNTYSVTVTDSQNCQTSSSIVITGGGSTTGIDRMSALMRGVKVYPNPAIREFTVEIEKNIIASYSLIIHDMRGKAVREYSGISDEKFEIEKDDLSPGLYQATMVHPNGSKSFKIMFSE